MREPEVSIVILNWNGRADTVECVDSVLKNRYPHYRVVIVDNGSEKNEGRILRALYASKKVSVIRANKNLGFTGGNNLAINRILRKGRSRYVFLLNNDTVVHPDFLTKLVRTAEQDNAIGVLGSRILSYYQRQKELNGVIKVNLWLARDRFVRADMIAESDYVSGCAMLLRADALKSLDFVFNDKYFLYYEDSDLCFRIREKGYKCLYHPGSVVWHKVGQSSGIKTRNPRTVYYYYRNKFFFIQRHAGPARKLFFTLFFMAVNIPWFVVRSVLARGGRINTDLLRFFFKGVKEGFRCVRFREERRRGGGGDPCRIRRI